MVVTGHHARLGTWLLAKLYQGSHLRLLNFMRLQGAILIEPDMQISRIRLSDKTAYLCTRKVIRSSPDLQHRIVYPGVPRPGVLHITANATNLGGHSLPGSQSGFILRFSM